MTAVLPRSAAHFSFSSPFPGASRIAMLGRCRMSGGSKIINRRCAVSLSIAALLGYVLQISTLHADQAFQRFFPLLVNLDGWQGKKPDGISMEMPGNP